MQTGGMLKLMYNYYYDLDEGVRNYCFFQDDNDKTTITFAIDSMTAVFFDGYSYQIEAVSNAYPPVTEEFKFTRGTSWKT